MKQEKCPKCGFFLTDNNYCIKCGYQKNITINDLKLTGESELELVLGNDYQKILYGQNSILIFLLGPLYICYRNFFHYWNFFICNRCCIKSLYKCSFK